MVKHDIKEISAYTLICSSSYNAGEGVTTQPQYFKFNAANPLSGDLSKQASQVAMCHEPSKLPSSP